MFLFTGIQNEAKEKEYIFQTELTRHEKEYN